MKKAPHQPGAVLRRPVHVLLMTFGGELYEAVYKGSVDLPAVHPRNNQESDQFATAFGAR